MELANGSPGFRSRNEAGVYKAIEAAGLPLPLVNTKLNGEEVDLHWPDLKLAVDAATSFERFAPPRWSGAAAVLLEGGGCQGGGGGTARGLFEVVSLGET